ncbi:MAG: phosphonate C-P lyase system protein PhnL [Alphaproteobacteria bacterium]
MARRDPLALSVEGLSKAFTLHLRDGVKLPVLDDVSFSLDAGECLMLNGPSGSGKSTLLRCIYGNYLPQAGIIKVRHGMDMVAVTGARPQTILALRRATLGYVSQFLRVIPRVATLDLVAEPLARQGVAAPDARRRAGALLERLGIPAKLWSLPPATFSGGEQQRVNLARAFIADYRVLLLDEPTASLDYANRDIVAGLIREALTRGIAIVGILHDEALRHNLATRELRLAANRVEA